MWLSAEGLDGTQPGTRDPGPHQVDPRQHRSSGAAAALRGRAALAHAEQHAAPVGRAGAMRTTVPPVAQRTPDRRAVRPEASTRLSPTDSPGPCRRPERLPSGWGVPAVRVQRTQAAAATDRPAPPVRAIGRAAQALRPALHGGEARMRPAPVVAGPHCLPMESCACARVTCRPNEAASAASLSTRRRPSSSRAASPVRA